MFWHAISLFLYRNQSETCKPHIFLYSCDSKFGQVKYLCNFAVALQIYTNNMKQSYIQRELSGIIE